MHPHRSLKTQKREIERIVKLAQGGDEEAFSKLYDLFVNPFYRYVYFRVNGTVDAEDLLATIFIKIWSNLKKYRDTDQSFSAWAYRIAHNVIIDFYRSQNGSAKIALLDESLVDEKRENHSKTLTEQTLTHEILKKAMQKLKDDYKQVVLLKFMNELENPEIAEVMGKTESSVRILQFRALRQLRKIFHGMGVTEW